jgi:hypothetical protein
VAHPTSVKHRLNVTVDACDGEPGVVSVGDHAGESRPDSSERNVEDAQPPGIEGALVNYAVLSVGLAILKALQRQPRPMRPCGGLANSPRLAPGPVSM